jgi:hypothetical protein
MFSFYQNKGLFYVVQGEGINFRKEMIWETLYKDLSGSAWTRSCVVIINTIKASLRRVYGTLGEEHKLRELENKVLRRIHGPRKKEVTD